MSTSTEYLRSDWSYYCRCPRRQRVENGRRPGYCYRCSLELPKDDE